MELVKNDPNLVQNIGMDELDKFDNLKDLSKQEVQAYIANAEEIMKNSGEGIEIPVVHHFSKSVYGREMRVPKGTYLVGKIHKHENFNILSQGEVSIISIDGIVRAKAPYSFVAQAGAKRLFYAHEDSVWTVIHGTDETDLVKIEDEFIAKDYSEVIEKKVNLCLG